MVEPLNFELWMHLVHCNNKYFLTSNFSIVRFRDTSPPTTSNPQFHPRYNVNVCRGEAVGSKFSWGERVGAKRYVGWSCTGTRLSGIIIGGEISSSLMYTPLVYTSEWDMSTCTTCRFQRKWNSMWKGLLSQQFLQCSPHTALVSQNTALWLLLKRNYLSQKNTGNANLLHCFTFFSVNATPAKNNKILHL